MVYKYHQLCAWCTEHNREDSTMTDIATGSRRGDALLAIFGAYDITGMLEEVVPLVQKMEQVKDDHPRYNGCFNIFMNDFTVIIKNAQADEDDVMEAIEAWLDASIVEIEAKLH